MEGALIFICIYNLVGTDLLEYTLAHLHVHLRKDQMSSV